MVIKGVSFEPSKDIPSLNGRVILITGGNTAISKQTALELAKHGPSQLWIAARNVEKGNSLVRQMESKSRHVSVRFLELDLSSFDSIKASGSAAQLTAIKGAWARWLSS